MRLERHDYSIIDWISITSMPLLWGMDIAMYYYADFDGMGVFLSWHILTEGYFNGRIKYWYHKALLYLSSILFVGAFAWLVVEVLSLPEKGGFRYWWILLILLYVSCLVARVVIRWRRMQAASSLSSIH